MSDHRMSDQAYIRELGDNLLVRWSTAADCERISDLYDTVFRRDAADSNPFVRSWTHEMMSGEHPLITAGDFALVEDVRSGVVVAATCLLGQQWSYDGVVLPVGRPEIVASLPEYRNKGLVRAVFALIHARSDARGDLLQGITGIEYYYRQFGYEYALDLGGDRRVPFANIPHLKEGESEQFTLRDATEADLPLIQRLYQRECTRRHAGAPLLVTTPIDGDYWRYTLRTGNNRQSAEGLHMEVLIDSVGKGVGYVILQSMRWDEDIGVRGLMVDEGVSLLAALPSLLRGIQALEDTLVLRRPTVSAASRIKFGLGREHPLYSALGDKIVSEEPPYAWYVRVPDLPALIGQIRPVLERRLAESYAVGYSGELRLSFYRGGLRMVFDAGTLTVVEPWQQDHNWGPKPHAGFPPLVFLQLLMGHRSLAELRAFLPDVSAEGEAIQLLDILFPRRLSWALPLE